MHFTQTADGADVVIQLNKQMFIPGNPDIYTSNLMIAKVIIHESIHAFLSIKGIDENLGMTIPDLNNTDVSGLINFYISNYPELQSQHNFMVNHMLPTMIQALSEIRDLMETPTSIDLMEDLIVGIPLGTNPQTFNYVPFNWNDYYLHLSLQGLEETDYFQENNFDATLSPHNQYVGFASGLDANKDCNE